MADGLAHRPGGGARTRALALLVGLGLAASIAPAATAADPSVAGASARASMSTHAREGRPTFGTTTSRSGDRILVRYRAGIRPADRSAVMSRAGVTRIARAGRARSAVDVVRTNGRDARAALANLRADPRVEAAALAGRHQLAVDPTTEPYYDEQWALDNVGQTVGGYTGVANVDLDAPEALAVIPGSTDIVVAVIDDGVDFTHPDLANAAWVNPGESGVTELGVDKSSNGIDDDGNELIDDVNGWDFCHGDNTVHDGAEDSHGTAVASTIAAELDGSGIAGLAPGVKIMALKFFGGSNCGWDDQAMDAIEYAKAMGADIVNASWGRPAAYDLSDDLLNQAIATPLEGATTVPLFVAAAGNGEYGPDALGDDLDAPGLQFVPAGLPATNILTVAAIHNQGGLADFSNYGRTSVDIAAPGEDIWVAVPVADDADADPGYELWSGTSFAAPYVTAVAALAASIRPSLLASPTGLRARVLDTGWQLEGAEAYLASGRIADAWWAVEAPDGVAATVTPLSGKQLGTSSIVARVAWPPALDDDGVTGYLLQQRVDDGAWADVGSMSLARSVDRTLSVNRRYEFRVLAVDPAFTAAGPATGTLRTPIRTQESSSAVRYGSGTWTRQRVSSHSGGAVRYATRRGAYAKFTFTGSAVAVVAPKGRGRGSAKIYIDGALAKTVSLYASSTRYRQVVYAHSWPVSGSHTVKVVVVGTSGRPRVDVDAFVVLK